MQQLAVIRLIDQRLAWYPPGAGREPRWLDDDLALAALRSSLAAGQAACFAAPGEAIHLIALTVAPEERRHLRQALPFLLEEQLAEEVEALHFASEPLDEAHYAVAVCREADMHAWREALAGLPALSRWVPETLLLPWREDEWCVLLESDRALVRLDHSRGFAAESALLAPLLEAAARASLPRRLVLYGQAQAVDLQRLPGPLRDLAEWRRGGFAQALGLADDDSARLNLLQGSWAPRLPVERWWRQWRPVAAALGLAFLVQLAATWADVRQLAAENLALRGAVEARFREAIPRGVLVDAEAQLRRQLEPLRGGGGGGRLLPLLAGVARAMEATPGSALGSLNYAERAGELRLTITAPDFAAVESLRGQLETEGLAAVMESSNAQGEQVRARLRVGGA